MNLKKYKHIKVSLNTNKNMIPVTQMTFDDVDEWNEIYQYARNNFVKDDPTKSGGVSNRKSCYLHERYYVVLGNQRFELVIISLDGCYRFLLQARKKADNNVSGIKACKEMYTFADEFGIDLSQYMSSKEVGKEVKKTIESPHIELLQPIAANKKIKHVYHMDFKSSYASRISEKYPELRPMFEKIYAMRKMDNGFYKHVLTNSVGCWQSKYCVDYVSRRKSSPYQFARLARAAINGTRELVNNKIKSLRRKGMVPLLTNTDGIWYYSDNGPYHDKQEGQLLGCWENDHLDCEFLMTSVGSYQYVEDGKCHTVVRGLCNLDSIEPNRDKWEFGAIMNIRHLMVYQFDEKKGVIKTNEN